MIAILISTFFMLGLSIERYRVIKYPVNARGRSSMKTEAVFAIICAILTSIVLYIRHQIEGVSYLSSPFVHSTGQMRKFRNTKYFDCGIFILFTLDTFYCFNSTL